MSRAPEDARRTFVMPADMLALRWGDNAQGCVLAVLAHRLAARGCAVHVMREDVAGLRAGDYVVAASGPVRRAIAASGIESVGLAGDRARELLDKADAVHVPRIAIFGGAACAYPYLGYYAHSLASLGLPFDVLDGAPVAAGALDAYDLLMLPGGFETWGLDRNEDTPGIDRAIRRFLARGGACIASCGGAFYLSEGRPHWLGVAQASPRYSHEYLRSGAGLVSIELGPGPLARGCAPLVEMPYYHGPIYEAVRSPTRSAAHFCALTLPARLPIDNPLDAAGFATEMAGKAAILLGGAQSDGAPRAVLFSPHPEMGDVVRKYIALERYVSAYLPIRGEAVMTQTLDFYEPNDSPSFRLILNAVQLLCTGRAPAAPQPNTTAGESSEPSGWPDARRRLLTAAREALERLVPADDAMGRLLRREITRLRALALSLAEVAAPPSGAGGALRVLEDAGAGLAAGEPPGTDTRALAQGLLAVELPLRFLEALARQTRCDAWLTLGVD
ncbi:hypothetical protein [Pandoraea sp.]|uniref:hypothetical protein n=1 Tax=Pandoraea sp. TaxID=1883445 RepID=UPI001202E202|nr:hypothetical protein [Pandoraea sp.]TAL57205.1 MAG: hypothetical protein EPN80_00040 [Pandoraea sp.]TAM16547.1 MAG: hypothetical protein EPN65_14740 [Pandoraea sp.]